MYMKYFLTLPHLDNFVIKSLFYGTSVKLSTVVFFCVHLSLTDLGWDRILILVFVSILDIDM